MTWLFAIYGSACAAVAIYYCLECSRLRTLRDRDLNDRETEQRAFQSGFELGVRSVEAAEEMEIEFECGCPECRAGRFLVN